jgi:uncharacterized protein involved in oxidation of intracellular sulfur
MRSVRPRWGQKTPEGYYNIERLVKRLALAPHRVLLCGSCMDARALAKSDLVDGAQRSTMDELARETLAADRTLLF